MIVNSDDPEDADRDSCFGDGSSGLQLLSDLIENEMHNAGFTYTDLAEQLRDFGIADYSVKSLKHKIKGGGFSAAFLLQVLCSIGCEKVDFGKLTLLKAGHKNDVIDK